MSQILDSFRSNPKLKIWVAGGAIAAVGVVYYVRKRRATATTTDAGATSATVGADGVPFADEADYYGGVTSGSPYAALSGLTYNAQTGQYEAATGVATASGQTGVGGLANGVYRVIGGDYAGSTVQVVNGQRYTLSGDSTAKLNAPPIPIGVGTADYTTLTNLPSFPTEV